MQEVLLTSFGSLSKSSNPWKQQEEYFSYWQKNRVGGEEVDITDDALQDKYLTTASLTVPCGQDQLSVQS